MQNFKWIFPLCLLASAMLLCGCASSPSPVAEKTESLPAKVMLKVTDSVAVSLASELPAYAQVFFEDIMDSLPGEYYYSEGPDNKIDSLFRKEDGKFKPVASIYFPPSANGKPDYILFKDKYAKRFVNGRPHNSFEGNISADLGTGKIDCDCIMKNFDQEGRMVSEIYYPKYVKMFFVGGNLQTELTGTLYIAEKLKDVNGEDSLIFRVENGEEKLYYENGKIRAISPVKNRRNLSEKVWDENGVLRKEVVYDNQGRDASEKLWNENGVMVQDAKFFEYFRVYYDSGKLKTELSGTLYWKNEKNVSVENGFEKAYYENGNVGGIVEYKDKAIVSKKMWNKDGVLIADYSISKNYYKEYFKNGKLKTEMMGSLYLDENRVLKLDSGITKAYYENGNVGGIVEYKDKAIVSKKMWNKDGVLIADYSISKNYYKEYFKNGKLKTEMMGSLYLDENRVLKVDSGITKVYSESGKILEDNVWKNQKPIAHKKWNEKGTLLEDYSISKNYYKEYFKNGKLKTETMGSLYLDENRVLKMDSGITKMYSESGKILEDNVWKNQKPIAHKKWNEKGTLLEEYSIAKNYLKEYFENGKLKTEMMGSLYFGEDGVLKVDSGITKVYYESGKILEDKVWRNKVPIAHKKWNEKGTLITDEAFPNYLKEYLDNGKIKNEAEGMLYVDEGTVKVDSGISKVYSESGKILEDNVWRNKVPIAQKKWNEQGTLLCDFSIPANYYKSYYNDGKIKLEGMGVFYWGDDGSVKLDSGTYKVYSESGRTLEQYEWKDKGQFARMVWNENGILTTDISFPQKYAKAYYDDGKIALEMTGNLYWGDDGSVKLDSGVQKVYSESGKILGQDEWESGKRVVAKKLWDENGFLTLDVSFPQKYAKVYFENGQIRYEMTGVFNLDEKGLPSLDSGTYKSYFENGKIQLDGKLKNKEFFVLKMWNENGMLINNVSLPDYKKEYYANGKLKSETVGKLVKESEFGFENGYYKSYYEDGSLRAEIIKKNNLVLNSKVRLMEAQNEGLVEQKYDDYGIQTSEKMFVNNVLKDEKHGVLTDKGKTIEWGYEKIYFENGKIQNHVTYENKRMVGLKRWSDKGVLLKDVHLPEYYKVFDENGKISVEATGVVVEENGSFAVKDGVVKVYGSDGQVKETTTYKNFQAVTE